MDVYLPLGVLDVRAAVRTPFKAQGIFVEMSTPFDHTGAIYRAKVEFNVAKWNLTTVSGYLAGGPAGEGPLLSAQDRASLWEWVRTASTLNSDKERMLIAGIDSPGVAEATALAEQADSRGFHAVAAMTPRFDRDHESRAETQLLYYRSLADRSRLPVLIHHQPRVTGVSLATETLLDLAKHPNIAGTIGSGIDVRRLAAEARKDFAILTGDETRLWSDLQAGAAGAVLGVASAIPYAAIAVWEAFRTREEEAGIDWQNRILAPAELVTRQFGPAGLKHAMDVNGYYGGPPRLPQSPLDAPAHEAIERAFQTLKG
ncbi:MAG: dihydrodipicolinate synthase family protein [Bryobacteraceae bacterium]